MMIVAVAQFRPTEDIKQNLSRFSSICEKASLNKVQLVVLPDDSFSRRPTNDYYEMLAKLSKIAFQNCLAVSTGNIKYFNKKSVDNRSFLISADGKLIGSQSKTGTLMNESDEGRINRFYLTDRCDVSILCGSDAFNEQTLTELSKSTVKILILQVNPETKLEAEAIKELAISISGNFADVVIAPWKLASSASIYSEGGFIACEGEIIEELNENQELVVATIKQKSFIDYSELREKIFIPQYLKKD